MKRSAQIEMGSARLWRAIFGVAPKISTNYLWFWFVRKNSWGGKKSLSVEAVWRDAGQRTRDACAPKKIETRLIVKAMVGLMNIACKHAGVV